MQLLQRGRDERSDEWMGRWMDGRGGRMEMEDGSLCEPLTSPSILNQRGKLMRVLVAHRNAHICKYRQK